MRECEPQPAVPKQEVRPKPKRRWFQYSLRTLLLLTLLCAIVLKSGLEWQRRQRMKIARNWARACLDQEYPAFIGIMESDKSWPPLPPCPAALDEKLRPIILKMAVTRLESPRERIAGLRILMESSPDTALAMLREVLREERDPRVKAVELRLVGLYRDATTAEMVAQYLDDADATIRAAAADALGMIHCPAYTILPYNLFFGSFAFKSDPPIDITALIEWIMYRGKPPSVRTISDRLLMDVIDLPAPMRAALETMMLEGPSIEERTAAARALLAWPPAEYRLRVAEWGVWINDGGQLKLAQAVLDEIPSFVHRTGNTIASLSDRLNPILIVTKPIVHFTADQPLAADMEVLIAEGRPWFAYPRPDDFTMLASPGPGNWGNELDPDPPLAVLDKVHVPELKPTAEGYPWLAPPHRRHGPLSAGAGAGNNEITDVGLRWQSLIISPRQQSWMTPPPVEDRQRYGWWDRLRSVPSCWLSSQGESERFLYYDGPTRMSSPVQAVVKGKRLHLKSLPMPSPAVAGPENEGDPLAGQAAGDHGTKRHGLYIEVKGGQTAARFVPVADGPSDVDLEAIVPMTSAAAQRRFLAMLTEYGLTADEAAGLADVWKRQFWETPGKRLLVVLATRDYDAMCPLRIRPEPTQLVRLGVLLTELPP